MLFADASLVWTMNGRFPDSKVWQRSAKEAYQTRKSLLTYTRMSGSGRSTLCPVPLGTYPNASETYPSVANQAKGGWGGIVFDTYIDDCANIAECITASTGTISSLYWVKHDDRRIGGEFNHTGTGMAVEAVPNKCRSAVSFGEGRPLDGDGIGPMPLNGESKNWSW
jgi:hypothetical protein